MFNLTISTKNGASHGRASQFLITLFSLFLLTACNGPAASTSGDSARGTAKADPTGASPDTTSSSRKVEVAASSDGLIIPGRSIGQVLLGDADSMVTARLGKPDSTDAAMGKAWLFWMSRKAGERTGVFTSRNMGAADETARVVQVLVTSPRFATTDGLHTGDHLDKIRQSFPRLGQQANTPVYDDRAAGIAFIASSDGRCTAIVVHRPGTDVQAITGNLLPH